MTSVETLFHSNTSMSEAQDFLDALCLLLPRDDRAECRTVVKSVLGSLESLDLKLMEDYTPNQFCSILGLCQTYCCATPYGPQEIHISLSKDPSQMNVMWVTQRTF
jgi:acid phosphatase type 7